MADIPRGREESQGWRRNGYDRPHAGRIGGPRVPGGPAWPSRSSLASPLFQPARVRAELAATEPHRLAAFLNVHALGVKALARHDHELLRMMLPYLRFESTDGPVTLAEFARSHPHVYVTPTVDEFRQVAPIATGSGTWSTRRWPPPAPSSAACSPHPARTRKRTVASPDLR